MGQINTHQRVKVFALFLIWTTMGLYLEIPGPTMIDIKLIFKASYEEVSGSLSGRGAGGFVGALLGGILVDKFDSYLDLQVAVAETIASLSVLTIPFSFGIGFLWFHYFTLGMCSGIINIAGIRLILLLSAEKTSALLLLLHTGYGLGSLLVPVIVDPFLAVIKYYDVNTGQKTPENFEVEEASSVHYAFVFVGISSFLSSLAFYYFHFKQRWSRDYQTVSTHDDVKQTLSFKEMINPGTCASGSFRFGLYMLCVLIVFSFHTTGAEEVMGNFIRTYSIDVFKFNKTEASFLDMTFWLSLTITRLLMSVISNYVPVKKLFKLQVLFHLFTATLLNVYGSASPSMLWLCIILQGVAVAPLFPSGIAYGNTQMNITGVCLTVIVFAGSFGDLTFMWVTGKLYDTLGPRVVLFSQQFIGVVLLICAVLFERIEKNDKEGNQKLSQVLSDHEPNHFKLSC